VAREKVGGEHPGDEQQRVTRKEEPREQSGLGKKNEPHAVDGETAEQPQPVVASSGLNEAVAAMALWMVFTSAKGNCCYSQSSSSSGTGHRLLDGVGLGHVIAMEGINGSSSSSGSRGMVCSSASPSGTSVTSSP
jgi:hypothetical protein